MPTFGVQVFSSHFDAAVQTVGVVVVVGEVRALSSQAGRVLAKSTPRPHEMQRKSFFAPNPKRVTSKGTRPARKTENRVQAVIVFIQGQALRSLQNIVKQKSGVPLCGLDNLLKTQAYGLFLGPESVKGFLCCC